MKTVINGKEFEVKQTGNRFYYFSYRAGRWLPVAKSEVIFPVHTTGLSEPATMPNGEAVTITERFEFAAGEEVVVF